eukprot:6224995-Ditylum_brightwellii.AAC.1
MTDVVPNVVETTWLARYPYPTQEVLDGGTAFVAEFIEMVASDNGVRKKHITPRNYQANSIIERIHQTIGKMTRSSEVYDTEIDVNDPWTRILSVVMFATRAMVHTTMQVTDIHLLFERDAILNVKHEAN